MSRKPALPVGFRLVAFDRIDSTSDEAKRRAAAGADEGCVILADAQDRGRGRMARQWRSPPGNLYFSLLLRPRCLAPRAPELGFVAGVALADAVAPLLPMAARLGHKWPNDLLIGGGKVAGILLESSANANGALDWLVVGIGVNIVSHPDDLPYPATSLAAFNAALAPTELLADFCRSFAHWRDLWESQGFETIRQAWIARADRRGETITARQGGEEITGCFTEIDTDGALVLVDAGGKRHRIVAGEVFHTEALARS